MNFFKKNKIFFLFFQFSKKNDQNSNQAVHPFADILSDQNFVNNFINHKLPVITLCIAL